MAIGSMFGPGQRFRTIILYTIIQAVAIYPLIAHAARLQSASLRAPSHRHSAQHDNHPESYPAYSNFVAHGQVHQKRDTSARCSIGFAGDQDTYGLGIRIGLYFQWVTSSIAYNLVPSEAITMRGVNNCFQAAMFAGLLFVTKTKFPQNELHAVEAYLMLLFCMGGVCSGTLAVDGGGEESTVRKGYAYLEASTLGGYVRLLLGTGFIAYGLWFVYVGMDGMLDAFPDDCRHAFFFAKVDLNGWFRTFLKVIFVFIAIPAVLSLAFGTHSLIKATSAFVFEGGWKGRVRNQNSTLPDEDTKPGFQDLELHKGNIGFSGALLLFIVAVELTIKWNKIEGVGDIGSTGQLLPVIIGVGGVGRVMVRLISDMLEHAALVRQEKSLRARTGAANNSVQVQDQLKSSQTTGGGNTFVHSIEGLHFSGP